MLLQRPVERVSGLFWIPAHNADLQSPELRIQSGPKALSDMRTPQQDSPQRDLAVAHPHGDFIELDSPLFRPKVDEDSRAFSPRLFDERDEPIAVTSRPALDCLARLARNVEPAPQDLAKPAVRNLQNRCKAADVEDLPRFEHC